MLLACLSWPIHLHLATTMQPFSLSLSLGTASTYTHALLCQLIRFTCSKLESGLIIATPPSTWTRKPASEGKPQQFSFSFLLSLSLALSVASYRRLHLVCEPTRSSFITSYARDSFAQVCHLVRFPLHVVCVMLTMRENCL